MALYKNIAGLFVILAILSMITIVSADENGSFITVTEADTQILNLNVSALLSEDNTTLPIEEIQKFGIKRIDQGQCVELGETYDISGLGWWSGYIGYYGRYVYDFSPSNTSLIAVKKIPYSIPQLRNFYIDPEYYSDYPGYWYNIPDNGENRAANERLFFVSDTCVVSANKSVSVVQEAINASQARTMLLANMSQLPVKTEEFVDVIISKNTTTYLESPPFAHYWVFGHHNNDSLYDTPTPNNITTFSSDTTNSLSAGRYDAIFVSPGKNEIFEETYDRGTHSISSPFRNVEDIDVFGYQPTVVEERLLSRVDSSIDDKYLKWRVLFQEPKIEIAYLNQQPLTNNQSFIMLKGYTNANPDTQLTIRIDANRTTGESYTLNTTMAYAVFNGGMAAYRTWNTTFIIDFNNVYPGYHDLTVTTDTGGKAIVPIYIRQELPAHYNPPTYLKFIDNSPFIEPVVVEKEVIREVPKIVTEIVIQKEEVDYGTLAKTIFWQYSPIVIGAFIVSTLIIYMVSVIIRSKERRKRNGES